MKLEKLLDSALQNTESKIDKLDSILSGEIDFFSEDSEYIYKKPIFTWGFDKIDSKFGMFDTKKFITIVGESGAGKTEYSIFLGNQNAKRGNRTIMLSLEMGTMEIYQRIAYKRMGIDKVKVNSGLSKIEQERVAKTIEELKRGPLELKGLQVPPTIDNIESIARKLSSEGYKLIIIDSMDKILGKEKQNDSERLAEISNKAKKLAIELDISIIIIHHFTKGSDKDRTSQRGIASMRGSGKIENDSDFVLQVYKKPRTPDGFYTEEEKQTVTLTLMKDRTYGDNYIFENIYFRNGTYNEHFKGQQ